MKKLLLTAVALAALVGPAMAFDEKKECIQYDKQTVTLTGTMLVRKMTYGKDDDAPPEGDHTFDMLVLDKQICAWGDDDSEYSNGCCILLI